MFWEDEIGMKSLNYFVKANPFDATVKALISFELKANLGNRLSNFT